MSESNDDYIYKERFDSILRVFNVSLRGSPFVDFGVEYSGSLYNTNSLYLPYEPQMIRITSGGSTASIDLSQYVNSFNDDKRKTEFDKITSTGKKGDKNELAGILTNCFKYYSNYNTVKQEKNIYDMGNILQLCLLIFLTQLEFIPGFFITNNKDYNKMTNQKIYNLLYRNNLTQYNLSTVKVDSRANPIHAAGETAGYNLNIRNINVINIDSNEILKLGEIPPANATISEDFFYKRDIPKLSDYINNLCGVMPKMGLTYKIGGYSFNSIKMDTAYVYNANIKNKTEILLTGLESDSKLLLRKLFLYHKNKSIQNYTYPKPTKLRQQYIASLLGYMDISTYYTTKNLEAPDILRSYTVVYSVNYNKKSVDKNNNTVIINITNIPIMSFKIYDKDFEKVFKHYIKFKVIINALSFGDVLYVPEMSIFDYSLELIKSG